MRLRQGLALFFLLCGFLGTKAYGQAVATWTDGSGNWSNAANWSTNTVPNNSGATTYDVLVYGTKADTITFDPSTASVNFLVLGAGETLQSNGHAPILMVGSDGFNNLGTVNWGNGAVLNVGGFIVDGLGSQLNLTGGSSLISKDFEAAGPVSINNSKLVVSTNLTIFGDGGLQLVNGSVGSVSGSLSASAVNSLVVDGSSLSVGQYLLAGNSTSIVNGSTLVVQGAVDQSAGLTSVFEVQASSGIIGGTFITGETFSLDKTSSFSVLGNFIGGINCTIAGSMIVNGTLYGGENLLLSGIASAGGFVTGGTSQIMGTVNVAGTFSNVGGSLIVNPTATISSNAFSQEAGSIDDSGTIVTHSFSQSGGSTIIERGVLLSATTFTATGGSVTVNGILDPTAVEIDSGATLQGTGAIIGNVAVGGTIMPGAPGMPGTMTIFGNYEQIGNGTFDELIGANSASFLNVNGDAALDSDSLLNITLLNGYDPLGQTFGIMDYRSLVGQFSNGPSFLDDGYVWDISYGKDEIFVTAVGTPEPSSLLLLFVGLLALALCVHRKLEKARRVA